MVEAVVKNRNQRLGQINVQNTSCFFWGLHITREENESEKKRIQQVKSRIKWEKMFIVAKNWGSPRKWVLHITVRGADFLDWSLLFKFASLFTVWVLHSLRILLYIEAKCARKSVANCTSPDRHFYAWFSEKLKARRSVLRLAAGWSNITLVQMFLLLCTNRARAELYHLTNFNFLPHWTIKQQWIGSNSS